MTVICRVCLCSDKLTCSINNTVLQGVWEKLTSAKFNTNDGKSLFVCYICCAHLRKSHELMMRALKAEELLMELINEDLELTEENISPIVTLAYELDYNYATKLYNDYDYEQLESNLAEGIEKENQEYIEENEGNIFIYIEDEEEGTQEFNRGESDMVSFELETCADHNVPLNNSIQEKTLQKEVRIVLERIEADASKKGSELNEAPQSKQIKSKKKRIRTKDKIILKDASFSDQKNNGMLSDICRPRSVSVESNVMPTRIQNYKNSHTSINNAENEIFRQCLQKSASAVAISTTLDKRHNVNKYVGNKGSENYFSCPVCRYKCFTKSNLNVHIRTHTGERPYVCQFCDYGFVQSSALHRHMRFKHTNVKKFSCHICQYKFVTKTNLNRHLRKHTGSKPYKCNKCDYTCSQANNLKRHMQFKHTNVKNFSCNVCGYECVEKSYMSVHLRIHIDDKPYRCGSCDYSSSFRSSLVRHIKLVHSQLV